MPTYVYRCEKCNETFEQVETMSEHSASKPQCPKCGGDKIARVPAPFIAKTTKKS
jgi:putative FmdB family regulatory protein